jgi:FkbH-like protein
MKVTTQQLINEALPLLLSGKPAQAVSLLEANAAPDVPPQYLSILRLAILQTAQPLLYYLRLNNLWSKLGRPALKPNPSSRKLSLLCDYTTDGLRPLLSLFAAAVGVDAAVEAAPFDSVEQLAIDPTSPLVVTSNHVVLVSLSEYWLTRYLGSNALVTQESVDHVKDVISNIIAGLQARSPGQILFTNFAGRAYPMPGGQAAFGTQMGWNRAILQLNHWLGEVAHSGVHVVDLAETLFAAGGRASVGRTSYLRSKMVFESAGTIAAAREIAIAVGHVSGKTHRAIVTDWDNTLWGGEVAEAGSHGVVCGLDNPDGLAYHRFQHFLKGLKSMGVLLAGASRNDPKVQEIFTENHDLPLKLEDFASLQVGFAPKSESVRRVSEDLGFGPEFMVFVDDSVFELTEVISAHPWIDVVKAGPDAEATLRSFSDTRFFNALSLSKEDLERSQAATILKQQRDFRSNFQSIEDFLRAIDIHLEAAPLSTQNIQRVAQMFQKSNQFNLTTRRHTEKDLLEMQRQGANITAFSYRDAFGPQGLISVIVTWKDADCVRIDSWLMSCRVLNRTVEQAVLAWIVEEANGLPILGEFIPTQKNGLVRDLYARFGFQLVARDAETKAELWRFQEPQSNVTQHYVNLHKAA